MRSIPFFLFVLAVCCLAVGCYESKPAPKYPIDGAVDINQPAPASQAGVNPNVKHYICSNNCAGSGGDGAGNCPVCGNAYVHNDAYHNNAATPAATPITPGAAAGGAATTQTSTSNIQFTDPNATAEPAQNAAGVWHYTCGAGCEGGAGTAGNCSKCGGALAHNAAYHN